MNAPVETAGKKKPRISQRRTGDEGGKEIKKERKIVNNKQGSMESDRLREN